MTTKTILIVDDSASMRETVKIVLAASGYAVLEAEHGREGVEKLDGRKIHLIVSDVNMPVMDGITFLREVKQMPRYKFTPVVMLTTESSEEMITRGSVSGASAWLVKPFLPAQLVLAVSKLILP
ncbi:response regulator [Chitinimonas sp. BJB300]|uniref:response regulator n=1 Tax=Chitinimonas sp. BJB300 TaxID=1559339 RepID=UPI0018EA9E73|nr:response regulator [Chitinimonas sp. BJB300]